MIWGGGAYSPSDSAESANKNSFSEMHHSLCLGVDILVEIANATIFFSVVSFLKFFMYLRNGPLEDV